MTRLVLTLALALCATVGAAADAAAAGGVGAPAAARPTSATSCTSTWSGTSTSRSTTRTRASTPGPGSRVHATKDYYDMAAMLRQYPDVHVTFNLTPVLLRQLDDLAAGTKDVYQVAGGEAGRRAHRTSDRTFILERFFDANWTNIIARFPRYQELLDEARRHDGRGHRGRHSAVHRAGLPRPAGVVQPRVVRPRVPGAGAAGSAGREGPRLHRGRQADRLRQGARGRRRGDPPAQGAAGHGADRGHHHALRAPHPAAGVQQQPRGEGRPVGRAARRASRGRTTPSRR